MRSARWAELCARYFRSAVPLHALALLLVCAAAYWSNLSHEFHLDSHPGLTGNSYVRSLRHVPQYFVDPLTLTSVRANGDYRPVLQSSYALNYALSGYEMWSWHLVQILLHAACAMGLYAWCRRLLPAWRPDDPPTVARHVPLLVGLVFALHPTASGVVNYLWARSSLLVAALLLPSVWLYMKPGGLAETRRARWGAYGLYALALWTKVEAVGALPVYFLYDAMLRPRHEGTHPAERATVLGDIWRALQRPTLLRMAPLMAITALYFVVRHQVMPDFLAEARHHADTTPWTYLLTQVTAWWHYVLRWFVPLGMVADDQSFAVVRSAAEPRFLLAVAGWLVVAVALRAVYPRRPEYAFLALSAWALVSPHSSVAPLAEMVNEHRPYLPMGVLSLAWLVPGFCVLLRQARGSSRGGARRAWAVAAVLVALLVVMGVATSQRNRVYRTEERYWLDVLEKAPSVRAYLNYGVLLLNRGQSRESLEYLQKSLELGPYWHLTHINLALAYQRLGQHDRARVHYDRAVVYDSYGDGARTYRGRYYLARQRYGLALEDFEAAQERAREQFPVYQGKATAYAGLGMWQECLRMTERCYRLDSRRCEQSIVEISRPFWLAVERFEAGLAYYRGLAELLPDRWWIHQNMGKLAAKLGRADEARQHLAEAARLRASQAR